MSYCEIIGFKNGKPHTFAEFRNAWGGAAYIWECLFNAFLKDPKIPYHSWISGSDALWKLHEREDVPAFMRRVHASTYDNAIIRRENFAKFVADLRQFKAYFGTNGKVCHLEDWAKFIEANQDLEAVGFYHTSVGENPWIPWDSEKDESAPYDLNVGTKHWEAYDEMDKLMSAQQNGGIVNAQQ